MFGWLIPVIFWLWKKEYDYVKTKLEIVEQADLITQAQVICSLELQK